MYLPSLEEITTNWAEEARLYIDLTRNGLAWYPWHNIARTVLVKCRVAMMNNDAPWWRNKVLISSTKNVGQN
jgi:hypothetical protein